MAVHTTLDSLIERVMIEEERKFDLLADTRSMSVGFDEEGEALLTIDQREGVTSLAMSDHMLGQVATDLEIPKRYFDRMKTDAPGLFVTNVHHWLYEPDTKPRRKLVRAYKGEPEVGRAWLSDRYRRLDNVEIARRLLPEFGNLGTEVKFHNASITETNFYIRVTFPAMTKAVKVGDPVEWGCMIRNSEVGGGQFAIENFVLRLVCTNGMVAPKVMSARHVGKRLGENLSDEAIRADDKAFWLAARDELRASLDEARFDEVLATLKDATDDRIGAVIRHPVAATETLAKSFSLSESEKEAVLLNLAAGGDMTRWGALNAVTAAAKTVESFDRRVELEETGWAMASMSDKAWHNIAVAA